MVGADTAQGSSPGVHALARVGAQCIAVANACVVQAVAWPARLIELPRRVGAIEGLFAFEKQLVPLVQLGRWVDLGAPDEEAARAGHRRILVLRTDGRVIGLAVDALMGVRQVRDGEFARVYHDERPEELFQSVIVGSRGEDAFSVLEPHRLMQLAGAWCDAAGVRVEPAQPDEADDEDDAASGRMSFAAFRVHDTLVGLRVGDVGELIPAPVLQAVLPAQSAARGICNWRGRFVPVVDLGPPLGAAVDETEPPLVCIVRKGDLAIGVLVHAESGLQVVATERVDRLADSDPAGSLLMGMTVTGPQQTMRLVDTAKLMQCFPETALSAPKSAASDDVHQGGPRVPEAFIVFHAGALMACPSAEVQEVVPLPAAVLARLQAGQPATLEWRGFAVPVADLRSRLPAAREMQPRQLVVVARGHQRVAVTIQGVDRLIPARTATRTRVRVSASLQLDMVTLHASAEKTSFSVLDLAEFLPAESGGEMVLAA